jgi:UDP-N-acetylmuramoyl-L-alanyl-D-glutamate--2,6-diaminopimelate ligase
MANFIKASRLTLNQLLAWLEIQPLVEDRALSGLAIDSRRVRAGDLFLALPGLASDGRDYIEAAIKAGAAAVLAEGGQALPVSSIPLVAVDGLQNRVGALIAHYYDEPSRNVKVIGVTGTNGKSSIVHFLGALLDRLSSGCGIMGTLGQGRLGQLTETGNTTADLLTINHFIVSMREQQVGWAAMEVSSHGIVQRRIDGLHINTAVFTNLTRDHLDYHGTMESYAEVKARLFRSPGLEYAVINRDDPWSELMLTECRAKTCLTYSLSDRNASVYLENIALHNEGMDADIVTPWGCGHLQTPLLGRFNLSNLLAVITTLGGHGIPLERILAEIPALACVNGRLQRFGGGDQPTVVVDYAHTSDALHNVLSALREHGGETITCVFGCGGDRDRGKRALMVQAACLADRIVVTTDNPRSEEPKAIIADVLAGLRADQRNKVTVVVDRAEAIQHAVNGARRGDVVLVAGKGHETYQEIKGIRYPFSDLAEVASTLSRRNA